MKKCEHRKLRTRGCDSGYFVECLGCGVRGPLYSSPTEAYLARRADLADAVAEKAAQGAAHASA